MTKPTSETAVDYYVFLILWLPSGVDPEDYLPLETDIRNAFEFLSRKQKDDTWLPVTYKYMGRLSQQQMDYLIEQEYRNSLTWIAPTRSLTIDNKKFPVVEWESTIPLGGHLWLIATLFTPPDDLVTDAFQDWDTFLSFIRKRYAGTHPHSCRCDGCQETERK
jgi:hypothetical protein